MSATASEPTPIPTGYVEATTETSILGWAWTPGEKASLTVELRLGPVVVAEAVADELRDDLAKSGIGEGRHAFTLTIPETHRARVKDLAVFARGTDGRAVPLGTPPVEDPADTRLATIQRGIEMLVGSQRVLHRNLQAALLQQAEKPPAPDGARPGPDITESIAALEHFVTRLEKALATTAIPAPAAAAPRRALVPLMAATLLALAASAWAVIHNLPG